MSRIDLDRIRIVLVGTSHPGNIGAAARAIKNMGLSRLYLVGPKEFPADKAVWRAANALDILDNAIVVDDLDEALQGCGFVVGTSARERRIPWPLFDPRQCGQQLVTEAQHHDVAVVFGREAKGLSNQELHKCHYHVHIPTNPDYNSLNLAMAVQVLSYEIRMASLVADKGEWDDQVSWDIKPARFEEMEMYFQHLEDTMVDLGFHDRDNPRQTMTRLRRLYNRVRLDQMELNILRGILTATQQMVENLKKYRKNK
jgi:tRNA (cytidine32/uridine32-2'-O)-methyltransferase